MSHTLTDRTPAWRRLGTIVEGKLNASEVLDAAHLSGWNVRQVQATFTENGQTYPIPNRFATVRTGEDGTPLGIEVVSNRYSVFQNEQLADIINSVADVSGAHYETAGYFRDGKQVFVNMKLPEGFTVAGRETERHDVYLLGTTTHDGNGKVQFLTTPVRVVCSNTLAAAKREFVTEFGLSHKGDLAPKIQEVRNALELQHKAIEEFQVDAERMLNTSMDDDAFKALAVKLFGTPQSPAANRRFEKLDWLWHGDSPTMEGIQGTRWGAWQALIEQTDFYDSPTGTDENRALRAVDGLGAKRKAQAYNLLAV